MGGEIKPASAKLSREGNYVISENIVIFIVIYGDAMLHQAEAVPPGV